MKLYKEYSQSIILHYMSIKNKLMLKSRGRTRSENMTVKARRGQINKTHTHTHTVSSCQNVALERDEDLKSSDQSKSEMMRRSPQSQVCPSPLKVNHSQLPRSGVDAGYIYMGVSCPVRSLNMAAGMVFMWI